MKLRLLSAAVFVTCLAPVTAQDRPVPPGSDDAVFDQIRREGLERSQVMTVFDQLVTVVGPRLSGTPAFKTAADWSRDTLTKWGLSDARLEPFEFGRGWILERQVIEMIEPRYMPLVGYAEAWSASTKGELVGTPIMAGGRTPEEVASMKDSLAGAIVLTQPVQAAFVRADRPQPTDSEQPVRIGAPPMPRSGAPNITQALRAANPGVMLRPSAGEHGTMFVLGRDAGENARPSVIVAAEHYNMIARMVERGLPVKLRVNVQTRFVSDDTKSYNVIAQIPGSDPALKDEVVMIGAHLDSWHSATGATDNADGCAAAMEALRILKAIGVTPRRTIRVALWGAEEQGLLGSKAYVAQHLAGDANASAREKFALYLNLDPGMGPIYGWYMENNERAKAIFDEWLKPLTAHGARRNVLPGIGSTDHLSFKPVNVPAFNPVQDYVDYDVRTHHTNVDTYERVREQDLQQNAISLAWFAYKAAMMNGRIPQ
jgi:carboxypeptidase Q